MNHTACLLLGSNIEPAHNLPRAVRLLQTSLVILKASSVWESASVDCCYPDYLNLALAVSTRMDAAQLKDQLIRPLEARMGRVRTADKNAPRPIDIDIILLNGKLLDSDLWLHAHRAVPVGELFPDYLSEAGEPLKDVARRLARSTPICLRPDVSISLPELNR
ncbi:MAG: 2-amino-4-hydroxy-6-hydroxymethyldihydropteridine diphosphokinase [Chloroflexi bacterium RBG_16_54_11]|nr:MAG: 2-amino-4-hydroxy-6-hydroxymethyldihydropteridine diphosphokinase [Chloroflexi bacterium RBG_16_54_11]